MNTLPLILTCLASGVVGAGATQFLMAPEAPAKTSQADNSELQASLDSLRTQLGEREQSFADLRDTVERLESDAEMVAYIPERSSVPITNNVAASGDEIAASLPGEPIQIGESKVSNAQFQNWVRQANAAIKAEEDIKRDQEREIRRGERIEEQIVTLTTDLGLDQQQQSEFRRHLAEQDIKRTEAWQAARESGGGRDAMREIRTTLAAEANTDLQTFLNGTQYETYQASQENQRGRGRGGNVGGGGGNNAAPAAGGGGGRGRGN